MKVFAPVPPVTVIVSVVGIPNVVESVPLATVRLPARVGAALIVTVMTDVVVAPRLSVAVIVSTYVPGTTPVAATRTTAFPLLAVVVSRVIPACTVELCIEKTKFPVPPVAEVVPPVTVTVSAAVFPTVVEIVEFETDAEGGALIV